jgi:hypothetical protein
LTWINNRKDEDYVMRKIMGMWFVALVVALGCGWVYAQEDSKPSSEDSKPQPTRGTASALPGVSGAPGNKPVHPYRVDFSINELEGERKINARHYSMNLNSGDWNAIKIGTRVPVVTETLPNHSESAQFQYLDVGTHINCKLEERGDELALEVHSDFSNLASASDQHSPQPIIRQININGSTFAAPGKPIAIGAVDDPNSNRMFQLEVTVTRLK